MLSYRHNPLECRLYPHLKGKQQSGPTPAPLLHGEQLPNHPTCTAERCCMLLASMHSPESCIPLPQGTLCSRLSSYLCLLCEEEQGLPGVWVLSNSPALILHAGDHVGRLLAMGDESWDYIKAWQYINMYFYIYIYLYILSESSVEKCIFAKSLSFMKAFWIQEDIPFSYY